MEPSYRRLALSILIADAILAAGCGHKGSPSPPLRIRPEAVKELRIRQRGDRVILTMAEPKERTDGSDFEEPVLLRLRQVRPPEPAQAKTKRRIRPAGGAQAELASWMVPQEEWKQYKSKGRLQVPISISSLDLPASPAAASGGERRVSFVAEVQEGRRKRGSIAGPVTLTLCEPPKAPQSVDARPAPGGVLVSWTHPGAPIAVNVYRAEGAEPFTEHPLRAVLAGETGFLDEAVKMGASYRYEVRSGAGEQTQRCESEPGAAQVTAVDTFAPAPPQGLAAAAETALIRLFWTPGPEADLAGYKVYRSEGSTSEFDLLTPSPIAETTYADTEVSRGVTYTYAITAVDNVKPPNESERSASASEALP